MADQELRIREGKEAKRDWGPSRGKGTGEGHRGKDHGTGEVRETKGGRGGKADLRGP